MPTGFGLKSKRAIFFNIFAGRVLKHIEEYTVPQYGDAGDDIASEYTAKHCADQIKKYVARVGTNSRGDEEAKRDFLKIAHYAQMGYDALEAEHVKK